MIFNCFNKFYFKIFLIIKIQKNKIIYGIINTKKNKDFKINKCAKKQINLKLNFVNTILQG